MALSNRDRIGKAMDLLGEGLAPFVEREMKLGRGPMWAASARQESRGPGKKGAAGPDPHVLLGTIWEEWEPVFKRTLGRSERTIVAELRDIRNKWAHGEAFSTDDTYRALDSTGRLLSAISAASQADEVERLKQEVLRIRFEEQARKEKMKSAATPIEGQPKADLRPWREIVTPHQDVASGRYQRAEFAADLWQVYLGEGSEEYRDPVEFYRRTYLTEGLSLLLRGAIRRMMGSGGDPVIELQTNFGGGKTHAMLALFHLFSGQPPASLPGLEEILKREEVKSLPPVKRVVLVGTRLAPGQPVVKKDGTAVRTIWGELAWQLGGKEAYKLVKQADETATNPGDALRGLLKSHSPCLILIDEWIAYARQLHDNPDLPAGTFDTQFTFAQALTEAVKAESRAMLVVSVPESQNEIGGERGNEALHKLKNAIGRVESPWRPASADESFEIVRRRLFEPIRDSSLFSLRDAAVRAFSDFYRDGKSEFPSGCGEGAYERRMLAAYPIHPELFDRLYSDWSSLDKFQRTRGVLRLMAAVIHSLWERQDKSLLILPASVPVDDPLVQPELTKYLEDNWVPVIEKDVDGPNSVPLELDRSNPNLGRYSAARRVARTIYMGSAPTVRAAGKGLEDSHIKLGCAQPGETVATFGDALRRLTDRSTFLYVDGRRYWYSTQPSVARLAEDRAARLSKDDVSEEIRKRLRESARQRGDFARVQVQSSGTEVPDEQEARLVILDPEDPHSAKSKDSPALKKAAEVLDSRGAGPRHFRNSLLFLAADRTRLDELERAVRLYLAWRSIDDDRESLNLDPSQSRQASSKLQSADGTVEVRMPEAYQWLLIPGQDNDPAKPIEWQEIRLQGQEALVVRASKKAVHEEHLIVKYGRLRSDLDRIPLWREGGERVGVRQLAEDFFSYLYLPRLKDVDVLLKAIEDATALLTWSQDGVAYASRFDSSYGRYVGLKTGERATPSIDSESVVVKPEAAARQLAAEGVAAGEPHSGGTAATSAQANGPGAGAAAAVPPAPRRPVRFHGSVTLATARLGRDAGRIAEEIVQHLSTLPGSAVEVTLEIHADVPAGAPDQVVRTVTENCRTLRFDDFGFEEE